MQYLPLGNTGLYVSRLCFGAMTFAEPEQKHWAYLGTTGQELADQMVGAALDAGINFFDTANSYSNGNSERILGKALSTKRQNAIIATKAHFPTSTGINAVGTSRMSIQRELEGSLQRLGTDYIDLYQVHSWDKTTPIEETLRALDDCVRQGKVRYIGLSNFAAWQIAKADGVAKQLGTERFCSVQAYYSLAGRDLENEILPAVQDLGLGTMIWSPLAGGYLSGKYTGNTGEQGRRSESTFPPIDIALGDAIVEAMRPIAAAHNASCSQIALAWLLHQQGVTSVVVGARKLEQLEDNLSAVDIELSEAELTKLDEVSAKPPLYPHWMPSLSREQAKSVITVKNS